METIHLHKIVEKDGEISVTGLPYKKAQAVEMTLRVEPSGMYGRSPLTARKLLQSGLIGLWRERADIRDSADYARQLREQAQRRSQGTI